MITLIKERQSGQELMDAAGLEEAAHREALEGLRRLNRASRAAEIVARPLIPIARRAGLTRITLLDVGCGGGDVPVRVAELAREAGITVELTLLDRSRTALATAEGAARRAGVAARSVCAEVPEGLTNAGLTIAGEDDRGGGFDVVMNSLFLHHLETDAVVATLAQMRQMARRMVLVSDLRRSAMGLAVAWTTCRILSRSKIVHHDGPASVRAAWTMAELHKMAAAAGMTGAALRIQRCWPWRMLLTWDAEAASIRGNGGRT